MANIAHLYSEHLEQLVARHRQLMLENQLDYLLIPSGVPVGIYLDDMNYPFKSSFLFRTYLPLTEVADSYLLLGLNDKPTLIYYQPVDFWHSPAKDPDGFWPEHFDIKIITEFEQAKEFFPTDSNKVAILGEETRLTQSFEKAQRNPKPLLNAIYWQRAYKSEYEIECLSRANQKATKAHKAAELAFRQGKSEQQIHLAYLNACGDMEHQMPYSNIVALNQHSAILHYTECESTRPQNPQSFLLDAGVSVNGYHSDITRSYAFKGNEFSALIDAMDKMQLACIDSIQVNQDYLDLHIQAHLSIAQILKDFDLVDMSAQAMLEQGISGTFFPHGLGHLIGLQVHDVGGQFADASGQANPPPAAHAFLRSTRKMENDMVFTIEPGLYFIPSLLDKQRQSAHSKAFNWDKIEQMIPFGGIRIEDNIVIHEDGVRNLTREAFAKL
ncbi:MAG: Xaa-Pro dipeptidase [Enterobacterales bacterium]|nr:Xaa-Pro dipeptidase [Enterobacterales bacterium]